MKGNRSLRPELTILFFCAVMLLSSPSGATEKSMIFFYSAETGINNFKSLKMEFDSYLAGFGNFEFQPFSSQKTFEEHIKGRKSCALILSAWHFINIKKSFNLAPAFVGVRDGKSSQKRILVGNEGFVGSVADEAVASAGNPEHTRSLLKDMLRDELSNARILTVPKDIDALMSVGFQMAGSALTTESALKNLAMLDPVLHSRMKVIVTGEESPLPIVATHCSFSDHGKELMKIITKMPEDPEGLNILNMLGLDGLKKIDKLE